jgi:hypothetical protein
VCVCVCVSACVRVCARACVCVCALPDLPILRSLHPCAAAYRPSPSLARALPSLPSALSRPLLPALLLETFSAGTGSHRYGALGVREYTHSGYSQEPVAATRRDRSALHANNPSGPEGRKGVSLCVCVCVCVCVRVCVFVCVCVCV